jgi:predicted RNase H-like HicB family nuclease
MRNFTAVVEGRPNAALNVGYVPAFPGTHSQAEMLDELDRNLREITEMILED